VSEKLFENAAEENSCLKTAVFYVMAPVMCLYIAWVLRKACAAGKKRLYFLARDGYSMYETARLLCRELDLPVECRYLYCSRYAWRSAEYRFLMEESLEYICLGGIDVTFQRVMGRAGLSESEGREIAHLLHREESYEIPMNYRQLRELKPVLSECRPFMEKMLSKSEEVYESVCGYLRQEGLLDEVPWALVDSGWVGSMQKSLQGLLRTMGYQGKTEGYYFGMYEYPAGVERGTYHSWYFQPEDGIRQKVYFSNSLFECIFSSPEGMTKGYAREEGGYGPVFEKKWNPNRGKIEKSTGYLKQYAEELAKSGGREFLFREGQGRKTAFFLLKRFMGTPSVQEAEVFGNYVFCDDVIGETVQRAAADLTPAQIRANRFLSKVRSILRKEGAGIRESAWLEGSITLAGMAGRELWHCAVCKYMMYFRKRLSGILSRQRNAG